MEGIKAPDQPQSIVLRKTPSTPKTLRINWVHIQKLLARQCRTCGNAPRIHGIEIRASFQVYVFFHFHQ